MPGLIDRIISMGLERRELAKDHPKAEVGGARIPYPPKDMASLVTLLKGRNVKSYLALEVVTDGAVRLLEAHLHIPTVIHPKEEDAKGLRKFLRTMTDPVDLISIDGRDMPLDAESLWLYIQGGRENYAKEFGKGAPLDYGIPKLRKGAAIIVNLADPASRLVWNKIRARHSQSYQSPFVGLAHVSSY